MMLAGLFGGRDCRTPSTAIYEGRIRSSLSKQPTRVRHALPWVRHALNKRIRGTLGHRSDEHQGPMCTAIATHPRILTTTPREGDAWSPARPRRGASRLCAGIGGLQRFNRVSAPSDSLCIVSERDHGIGMTR
jgi:hypothetical protein